MTDLRKILASKLFVESSQIQFGYARFLRTAFWLRLLQISCMFNFRFKVQIPRGNRTAMFALALLFSFEARAENKIAIFDGNTLDGWEGDTNTWRVEQGTIAAGRLEKKQPHNDFLATTREFENFELHLQYKVEGSNGFVNGGVQFWSKRVPYDFEVSGFQADLGADTDGNLYDESRRNKNLVEAKKELRATTLKPGDWNDYRIRAEGSHIQLWLNGVKTVDYIEDDKSIPHHGFIALQIHGGAFTKVQYRHLQLEELPVK